MAAHTRRLTLLLLSAAHGAEGAALAGRWHGFEQRFHATSGSALRVPDEYAPSSALEWGTVPFGFAVELELPPAADEPPGAAPAGGVIECAHVRQLLWSGCFIEGPSQTAETWSSRRAAPRRLAGGSWAASDGVSFDKLPLPYRAPLRIAELRGEAVSLLELALLAADGRDGLCLLHLALGVDGALLLPPLAAFCGRTPEAGAALAKRLDGEARRAAERPARPAPRGPRATLELGDGLRLALEPAPPPTAGGAAGGGPPSSAFALVAAWRGAGMRVEWRDGRICGVAPAALPTA